MVIRGFLDGPGASSGGSGSTIKTSSVTITDGAIQDLASAASWTVALTSVNTPLQGSIAAATGDRVRVFSRFMYNGSHFLDWAVLNAGGSPVLYLASGTGSPLAEGDPAMYPSTSFAHQDDAPMFTVQAGHLNAGSVTVALFHQGTSAARVYANSVYPWKMRLENIGPEPA